MPTYFRDRIHTTLTRADAEKVVREIEAMMDAALPSDADQAAAFDEPPAGLEGLSVASVYQMRSNEDDDAIDVYEGLDISVDADGPPNAAQAKERARATGYVEHSFVFEPAAMKLLAECQSTIALRYPARLQENRAFVALLHRLFTRAERLVVEGGDGTRWETAETVAAAYGDAWQRAAKASAHRENRKAPKAKKTREAKPGEIEAVALHEKLSEIVEGDDPFVKKALRTALERASEDARTYAAALLEEGAKADATLAKVLGRKPADVARARTTLAELVDELPDG
jgi:hypothetical protein